MRGGGLVRRAHTVSVRVSEQELAAWRDRRDASGRRELGAWVRAVVNEVAGLSSPDGRALGDPPAVPAVNVATHRVLVGAAANLNQLTRLAHARGVAAPAGVTEAVAVLTAAGRALLGRGLGGPAAGLGGPR